MLQLSEDMMRATRRFDAAGRPGTRDQANELAYRQSGDPRDVTRQGRFAWLRAALVLLSRIGMRGAIPQGPARQRS